MQPVVEQDVQEDYCIEPFYQISHKDGYKIKSHLQEVIDRDLDLDEGVAKGQEVTVEQGVE